MLAGQLSKDRLTSPTDVRDVCSKFHPPRIVVLMINWKIKFRFGATKVVDLMHWTYFYDIQQMGMKERSLIGKTNQTCIALTAMAVYHCRSAWRTDKFGFFQSLVQEIKYNFSVIEGMLITQWIMNQEMNFVIWTQIFLLPRNRLKPRSQTISATSSAKGSTQPVPIQRRHHLKMISEYLMWTFTITCQRCW